MEHEQAINTINEAIKKLCEKCDPKCAATIVDNSFPHCYLVHSKQQRLWGEIFKGRSEAEGKAFAEDADLKSLSWGNTK